MPADTALQAAARRLIRWATFGAIGSSVDHVPEQHEQRIARRVRNAEHVRRGDVLARVPHRRRRRERDHVQQKTSPAAIAAAR